MNPPRENYALEDDDSERGEGCGSLVSYSPKALGAILLTVRTGGGKRSQVLRRHLTVALLKLCLILYLDSRRFCLA